MNANKIEKQTTDTVQKIGHSFQQLKKTSSIPEGKKLCIEFECTANEAPACLLAAHASSKLSCSSQI